IVRSTAADDAVFGEVFRAAFAFQRMHRRHGAAGVARAAHRFGDQRPAARAARALGAGGAGEAARLHGEAELAPAFAGAAPCAHHGDLVSAGLLVDVAHGLRAP